MAIGVKLLSSRSDDSAFNEKTILHIAEETDEAASAGSPSTHTTEDLFTIIHRFECAHVTHRSETLTITMISQQMLFLRRQTERCFV